MECQNCIYYPKCAEVPFSKGGCADYMDKKLVLSIPYKIGDTVYLVRYDTQRRVWTITKSIVIAYSATIGGVRMEIKNIYGFRELSVTTIGKQIFPTLEDAKNYVKMKRGNVNE